MNKIILILTLTVFTQVISQIEDTSYYLKSSYKPEVNYMEKAGSCFSPDGPVQMILSAPGGYSFLENNGYCYNGINTTSNVTMCFTFIPTSSRVSLNGGYTHSCNNNNFSSFTLYNSACNYVTSSLNPTGLTAGQQYTWCVTMRAWGGWFCNGYENFCPYWIPIYGLSSNISSFTTDCEILEWATISENNTDKFSIEGSEDGTNWNIITEVKTYNSITGGKYSIVLKNKNDKYYRLFSYDYDGSILDIKTVYSNCDENIIQYIYDSTGRYVGNTLPKTSGLYFIRDSNGNLSKIII